MDGKIYHTPGPWEFRKAGTSILNGTTTRFPAHVVHHYKDNLGRRCMAFVAACDAASLPNDANACLIATAPEMAKLLEASRHLLKSYEYGNSATEPAKDMADRIEQVLKDAGIEVKF